MDFYLIIITLLITFVVLSRLNSTKVIYLKRLAFPIICCLFILSLIAFSETAVKAALKGINLWLYVVFPSLFPFFIGAELLNKSGFVKSAGVLLEPIMRPLFNIPGCGSFAFAMGITSGYPVGAKLTTGMREERLLTRTEAERLLAFTNNSGPLFIIGAVSVGMFNKPQIGVFLLLCHILACISVGLLFRFYGSKEKATGSKKEKNIYNKFKHELRSTQKLTLSNLGGILGDSIRNSVSTMLAIGGYIIFFSVIINLLIETGIIGSLSNLIFEFLSPVGIGKDIINAVLCGLFEITTGTNLASKASAVNITQQMVAASIIIGWAGFSVHSQVMSIISNTDISIKPYLCGKLTQGILSGIYTYIGIKIAGHSLLGVEPVFTSYEQSTHLDWYYYFLNSCKHFFILMGVIAAFTTFSAITRHLFGPQKSTNR
jgi:sporulation integral membrane protein YlbJ